jgi:hypothetical protein
MIGWKAAFLVVHHDFCEDRGQLTSFEENPVVVEVLVVAVPTHTEDTVEVLEALPATLFLPCENRIRTSQPPTGH